MKLISLNTWGGKYFEPLINFMKKHSKNTDIFCLQEIYHTTSNIKQYKNLLRANLLEELRNVLKDFQVFYFPTLKGYDDEADPVDFDLLYGSAIFVKNSLNITSHKDYIIYKSNPKFGPKKDFSNLTTPLQNINFTLGDKKFSIFNFHGNPFPANKLDSPNRLDEAKKVNSIIRRSTGAKILVGDFNLLPETESLTIIGQGMRNSIREYSIERTRSNLSPYFGIADFQKFADYAFVSNGVKVKKFEVPEVEISDHLPLIVEFS